MLDKSSIKNWSEEDRPREKLLLNGRETLSEAELIAILIGSGNTELSAVELSRRILQSASNNLHELSRWEVSDFTQFKGIGEAKAISIVAALELGRRKILADPIQRKQITSSTDTYNQIYPILADLNHEEFWVIFLNQNNRLISKSKISQGGISQTAVDTRIILKKAIHHQASTLILAHNHPSGSLQPSKADIAITQKIAEACKYLDMRLVDHLIIAQGNYYSFADEGRL